MEKFDVIVRVPCSTANLGSGFDCIGMALQLYTTIKMKKTSNTSILLRGENLEGIPTTKENLIYKIAQLIFKKAKYDCPELEIEIESEIPLTRGLGSSAAAIVGAMAAANVLAGEPFTKDELYLFSSELEGHPDNVGASLLGGIVIATYNEEKVSYIRVSPPPEMKTVVAVPHFELSTKLARDVLPNSYSKEDAVYAIGHSALLASALVSGNTSLLNEAMRDRIHQPFRTSLVPGMNVLLDHAHQYGALGIALSGAGPTIIALTDREDEKLQQYMHDVLLEHGISSTVQTLIPDNQGIQIQSFVTVN
ncbi:homoserine kinase [Bacillus pinisoli]|uniref:homoserine kinase n=1 Tax=Bacillus pinisoli TaxID=2901866 RepID=UPI001FF541EB|nr:homoserine kinase [Bacillus pinisoli]